MIRSLAITFALLQPTCYDRDETALWFGRNLRVWNQLGCGVQLTRWPATETWIVTVGFRGRWLKCFRAW
jgi:hypothetical protein